MKNAGASHWRSATAIAAALTFGIGFLPSARAEMIPGYPDSIRAFDAREVALLPRYCLYTQDFREHVPGANNPAEIESWYARWGQTFHAMHHYCYGLMKTNRGMYLARDLKVRHFYLQDAIPEFDWVIQRAPPDFVLLPEILTKKGENLILVGKGPLGMESLRRAIELKPDYWYAYALMSDYYRDNGDRGKARELLERGLKFAPDAKGLKRRLSDLDAGEARYKSATPSLTPKARASAGR